MVRSFFNQSSKDDADSRDELDWRCSKENGASIIDADLALQLTLDSRVLGRTYCLAGTD